MDMEAALQENRKIFAQYAKQAFRVSFKKVTYEDYEAHRDEMSSGTWPPLKGGKVQKIITAFHATLREKSAPWSEFIKWITG